VLKQNIAPVASVAGKLKPPFGVALAHRMLKIDTGIDDNFT